MAKEPLTMSLEGDGPKRVHWKEKDLSKVIPKTAEILIQNPKMGMGPALIEAQNLVLARNRRRSALTLKNVGHKLYHVDVYAEMNRQAKARKAVLKEKKESPPAEPGSLREMVEGPKSRPLDVLKSFTAPVVSVLDTPSPDPLDLNKALDLYTDAAAARFKTMLREKLDRAYREAMSEQLVTGVPPLLAISGGQSLSGHTGQKPPTYGRVKVLLVGNSTDAVYFTKVTKDLDQLYEFVEVRRPGDVRGHEDAKVIIATAKEETPALVTAKMMCKGAEMILCKYSLDVNEMLFTRYQMFLKLMVEGSAGN